MVSLHKQAKTRIADVFDSQVNYLGGKTRTDRGISFLCAYTYENREIPTMHTKHDNSQVAIECPFCPMYSTTKMEDQHWIENCHSYSFLVKKSFADYL